MKKVSLIILGLLTPLLTYSQTKIPATTKLALHIIEKDRTLNENNISSSSLNMYPVKKHNGDYFLSVLCKLYPGVTKPDLLKNNWEVGSVIGDIATVNIPLAELVDNFSSPLIQYLELSERFDPYLDQAVIDIHADSVHQGINLPQSYTGKNVLVGIVDWGFDYRHPVFYDTSLTRYRVAAAWDQAKTGTPPPGFNYGTEYTDSASLHLAQADTFSYVSDYHGTHVAGICGGAGGGTEYRGVGFESDLLFSQMNGHAAYSLDAYQWMFNKSNLLGKRLVINNSFGSYRNNPLDGTSLFSQAMDAYSDSGVVFVVSAGNAGGTNFHIKKTFATDSMRTRLGGFGYSSDPDLWGQTISMWGEQGNNFAVKVRIINTSGQQLMLTPLFNTANGSAFIDSFMVNGIDTVFYSIAIENSHPLNGRPQMNLDVRAVNAGFKVILIAEANTGTVHFWNTRKTIFGGGNWGKPFTTFGSGYTSGDNNYGIGHPSVTNSAISVAAYSTFANIVSFSSYGPRMDEEMKPDIAAPGVNIVSSFNSHSLASVSPVDTVNFNGDDYYFIPLSGTSMAGPVVTGVVSLMLEANPNATPDQIKYIIKETARNDSYTGTILPPGDIRWGMGKINAYDAVQLSFTAGVEESQSNLLFSIYPNPAGDLLMISGELKGMETISVYSIDGKLIYSDKIKGNNIDVSKLISGIYIVQISSEGNTGSFRLVKN